METDERISEYYERAQISELLTRYFGAVDDKQLDTAIVEATYTTAARILRPNGSALVGHADILAGHKTSFTRFKATHHVLTDYIIDLDVTHATIRVNLTAMHLWADDDSTPSLNDKHFLAGAVLTAKAVKTNTGWRVSELTNRNVWRTGEGMTEMANYQRPND